MTKRSELVLPPGTFAYSLDRSNAKLSVLVGPIQNKLEEQEGAVLWDRTKGRTVGCPVDRAVQAVVIVPADSYAVITNPYIEDGKIKQPPAKRKTLVDEVELAYGRVEHVPGPTAIIPWPGQEVQVRKRVHLARDQYVRVEVTDTLRPDDAEWFGRLLCLETNEQDAGLVFEFRPGDRFIVTGRRTSLFTPPTGVAVGPVEQVKRLEPFECALLVSDDGTRRYLRGPETFYPSVGEKIASVNKAVDLRRVGLHIRVLKECCYGTPGHELFLTYQNEPDESLYYWPDSNTEIVNRVEPIDIPDLGGVYLQDVQTGKVEIYREPGPFIVNPLTHRLVKRDSEDSWFAPAVIVQENQAVCIAGPDGGRVVVGPKITLLEYNEQEDEVITIRKAIQQDTRFALTADGVEVYATVEYTRTLVGPPENWFCQDSRHLELWSTIERIFVENARTTNSIDIESNRYLFDEDDNQVFEYFKDSVLVSGMSMQIRFAEPQAEKAIDTNRKQALMNRLQAENLKLVQAETETKRAHADAMAESARVSVAQVHANQLRDAKTEAEVERVKLEEKRATQEVLDDLLARELEREERRRKQELEHRERELELEQRALEQKTAATVNLLKAIQPDLIAAIRTAGIQTNFAKVVQHLGPSAVLSGVGLPQTFEKILGKEGSGVLTALGQTGD